MRTLLGNWRAILSIVATAVVCAASFSVIVRSADLYATLARLPATPTAAVADSQILARNLYDSDDFGNRDSETANHWTLLVVTGRDCRACAAAIAAWEQVIDARHSVRIRVAAAEPQELERQAVDRIRSKGADAALWPISDLSHFRIRTGVKLVPMTMLIDPNAAVRIAVSGVPSDPIRHALRRMVTGHELDGAPALFEHNTGTDWIEGPSRGPALSIGQ